jgi:hypothetical protein
MSRTPLCRASTRFRLGNAMAFTAMFCEFFPFRWVLFFLLNGATAKDAPRDLTPDHIEQAPPCKILLY